MTRCSVTGAGRTVPNKGAQVFFINNQGMKLLSGKQFGDLLNKGRFSRAPAKDGTRTAREKKYRARINREFNALNWTK